MKTQIAKLFFVVALIGSNCLPAFAQEVNSIDCSINALLGGDCLKIQRINKYQDQQRQAWLAGSITGYESVNSVMNYHRSLMPINSYDMELYMYSFQVVKVTDAGTIDKFEGMLLISKKENELSDRIAARQPPPNRSLRCKSETFGGTTTTKCE